MAILMAILVAVLYAAGLYLMLRRSVVKIIIGLAILSQAANVLIFTSAGLTRGQPPLIALGETAPPEGHADPLPQALILTAIVISFGVLAFAMVLIKSAYEAVGSDDIDNMRTTDT